ncbi:MAG: PBP1A family penicillin-binding protein [Aestuariivita sp.]|nr:PBP1A family penicillin-binding protein [Aestuariivita sp.]
MTRFFFSLLGTVFSLVTLSAIILALSLFIVFYIYGNGLPSHDALSQYKPPTISRIYSGEGRLIDEFAKERRLFTPVQNIPDLIKQAFISAEDKNFYSHQGYDVRGMIAAGLAALQSRGETLRGASTITQQVMKNFLLSSDRRIERKIKEIILATRLEKTLEKEAILELYLNEIFLGQNSYGVTAAAQSYFNKTLSELKVHEAAFLAALPKAPSRYHPVRRKESLKARRNFVLKEMYENGYITEALYQVSIQKPLQSVQNGDFESFASSLPPRDYFTDEIRRQLSRDFGDVEFFSGGFAVRATIDAQMQFVAALALREALEKYDQALGIWRGTGLTIGMDDLSSENAWREALNSVDLPRDIIVETSWYPAVVLALDDQGARVGIEDVPNIEGGHWILDSDLVWKRKRNLDGSSATNVQSVTDLLEIGDIVFVSDLSQRNDNGSSAWSLRQVPEVEGAFVAMDVNNGRVLAMQGGFSYQHSVFNRSTQALRQPGSSFKPFVYAAALDNGFSPATIVLDAPIEIDTPQGLWRPQNAANKFYGAAPLRTGIERSRNLMTIRLAREIGMDVIAEYAERFGVYDNMGLFLANSLGSEETTLYKMVTAYAMFANGGERVQPTLVDRIQDRNGETIYRHDERECVTCQVADLETGILPRIEAHRQRIMNSVTAYQLTSMMQGVVERGTASATVNLPVPVAGKTGTTNEAKDVWFIGFTSGIVAGCYIGFDQPKPLGRSAFGGSMCGPVFQKFVSAAIEKYGGSDFVIPSGGEFIKIDRFTGARLPDDAQGTNVVSEYFLSGEEPEFGLLVNGGFVIGSDLQLTDEPNTENLQSISTVQDQVVTEPKTTFGSLSSGGLY